MPDRHEDADSNREKMMSEWYSYRNLFTDEDEWNREKPYFLRAVARDLRKRGKRFRKPIVAYKFNFDYGMYEGIICGELVPRV